MTSNIKMYRNKMNKLLFSKLISSYYTIENDWLFNIEAIISRVFAKPKPYYSSSRLRIHPEKTYSWQGHDLVNFVKLKFKKNLRSLYLLYFSRGCVIRNVREWYKSSPKNLSAIFHPVMCRLVFNGKPFKMLEMSLRVCFDIAICADLFGMFLVRTIMMDVFVDYNVRKIFVQIIIYVRASLYWKKYIFVIVVMMEILRNCATNIRWQISLGISKNFFPS